MITVNEQYCFFLLGKNHAPSLKKHIYEKVVKTVIKVSGNV